MVVFDSVNWLNGYTFLKFPRESGYSCLLYRGSLPDDLFDVAEATVLVEYGTLFWWQVDRDVCDALVLEGLDDARGTLLSRTCFDGGSSIGNDFNSVTLDRDDDDDLGVEYNEL